MRYPRIERYGDPAVCIDRRPVLKSRRDLESRERTKAGGESHGEEEEDGDGDDEGDEEDANGQDAWREGRKAGQRSSIPYDRSLRGRRVSWKLIRNTPA